MPAKPPDGPQPCGYCGGSGQITVRVVTPKPGPPETQPCPACHGSGLK